MSKKILKNNTSSKKTIEKTKFYSYKKKDLCNGCKLCVNGEKSVLFITGVCPRNCFFCPISEKKKNKDVKYINERKYETNKELIEEIKISGSKGAGITGGEPLCRLDRTIDAIKLLKKEFGKNFHIHMYTSLNLVTKEILKKLHDAGLDEIRFHADLDSDKLWNKINLAKDKAFSWNVGIEIPAIPGKEKNSKKLVTVFRDIVDFFNFNELEISDLNAKEFQKRGFFPKDDMSYAVQGSEKVALSLLKLSKRGHYCTCKLKDNIQLGKRIKLRAQHIKKQYDQLTNEGMLFRGAIYINAIPTVSYKKILENIDSKKELQELDKLKTSLIKEHKIKKELIDIDKNKLRLLTSAKIAKSLAKKINQKCAWVLEYPTYDNMEVELEFLN